MYYECKTPNNQKSMNKEINLLLEREKQTIDNNFNVLLLGECESGKSTIIKLIKNCTSKEDITFDSNEIVQYKSKIHRDTFSGFKYFLEWEKDSEILNNLSDQLKSDISIIKSTDTTNIEIINEKYCQLIENLWKDNGIKQLILKTNKINITSDTLPYFLNNIKRISNVDYIPTISDILNTYFRTIGIHENQITINTTNIKFIELGGLIVHSSKKVWTPYFDDFPAILYCVSLNEFDKFRNDIDNCMLESLKTFEEIVIKTFPNSNIILYFTKSDLFKDKILNGTGDLSITFPDYNGGKDYDAALSFIIDIFLKLNNVIVPPPKRSIYHTSSNILDATNVLSFTYKCLQDITLNTPL